MRRLGGVVAAIGGLVASGCAAIQRPPATVASLVAEAPAAAARERAVTDSLIERLVARAMARGDGRLDILVLSGGGQNGAFGAGFLRAWKDRPNDAMPTFDLVTGISTGAVQAPYALLGTHDALDTLASLYRRAAEEIAPTFDPWFFFRRTGGFVNTSRFRRTVARELTAAKADQLRAAFDSGRGLAIATTDMDLGVGRTWDLAREIGPRGSVPTRYHDLVMAATAIPGIFPPLVLDGHVHSDGGVIANALLLFDVAAYRRLAERLKARGVTTPVTIRLYGIWNLWAHDAVRVITPSSRKQVKGRSDALLFYAAQPLLMARLHELGLAVSRDVPGLTLDVRHTAIPSGLANEPGASALFDGAWMRRLEQVGRDRALSATPWDAVPSAYARP